MMSACTRAARTLVFTSAGGANAPGAKRQPYQAGGVMKVKKITSQPWRDFTANTVCEHCGKEVLDISW